VNRTELGQAARGWARRRRRCWDGKGAGARTQSRQQSSGGDSAGAGAARRSGGARPGPTSGAVAARCWSGNGGGHGKQAVDVGVKHRLYNSVRKWVNKCVGLTPISRRTERQDAGFRKGTGDRNCKWE